MLLAGGVGMQELYAQQTAPNSVLAKPTTQQLDWQRLEYYGFIHLGINTFTAKEWGYGDEDPKVFNPKDFNADEIVALFKKAGMKGVILTCKHHDGFCLWPTKTTEHNITKAPWRDGKGDMVKEVADACRKHGIKFGAYISPWDRNHAEYGREGYVKAYHEQIRELLTNYGDVFEIWFDGANGGDGYYGGARETRTIGENYYRFDEIVKMIRKIQPNCIIWGAGSIGDARWGGSERGHVGYPHWHTLNHDTRGEGSHAKGVAFGNRWVPAEGDTSIRHGWFWHERYNNSVKTPQHLFQIWSECVGRGANLILNVPPDRSGKIYPADAKALLDFAELRNKIFANNLAKNAKIIGSSSSAQAVSDANFASAIDGKDGKLEFELQLDGSKSFDLLQLHEDVSKGQCIDSYEVFAWQDNGWVSIHKGQTVSVQRLAVLDRVVTSDKLKLVFASSRSTLAPSICEVALYAMPVSLDPASITRDAQGLLHIAAKHAKSIHYTLDGSEPTLESPLYSAPVAFDKGGTVKVLYVDKDGNKSPVAMSEMGVNKSGWKIVDAPVGQAANAIDDNPKTFWHTHPKDEMAPPQHFSVDMGKELELGGFTYLPRQDGTAHGMTSHYIFSVSADGKNWQQVAEGEFSNIKASPILQKVNFTAPVKARYFKFTGTKAVQKNHVSAAEVGVLLK